MDELTTRTARAHFRGGLVEDGAVVAGGVRYMVLVSAATADQEDIPLV